MIFILSFHLTPSRLSFSFVQPHRFAFKGKKFHASVPESLFIAFRRLSESRERKREIEAKGVLQLRKPFRI